MHSTQNAESPESKNNRLDKEIPSSVKVISEPLDPWQEITTFQSEYLTQGEFGATATFVGTMRDFNEGDDVTGMTLEHYPGMTEKQLQEIIHEAQHQWTLNGVLIVHRVGPLLPGDPIVIVACWSAHRADAFEACRQLMEALKSRIPFWKKETLSDESDRWVEKNTDGYTS